MVTDRIVLKPEIVSRTGRPDRSLARDIRVGEFPRLFDAGPGRRGVLESELAIVLAARAAGAARAELRDLVKQIHCHRRRLAAELGLQEAA